MMKEFPTPIARSCGYVAKEEGEERQQRPCQVRAANAGPGSDCGQGSRHKLARQEQATPPHTELEGGQGHDQTHSG